MKPKNLKFVIGGVLIVGVVIWIFGSISSKNLTYYYTPAEVIAEYETIKHDAIRVMGLVKTGSLHWLPKDTRLEFQITDETEQIVAVQYTGAKPDMLREGQGVVAEGTMIAPGQLQAETLLVKHSEDYKTTEHSGAKADYYKTLSP